MCLDFIFSRKQGSHYSVLLFFALNVNCDVLIGSNARVTDSPESTVATKVTSF